jgi:endonuclease/exonuclease/phosphatase (EEP) superfamily protein YafD
MSDAQHRRAIFTSPHRSFGARAFQVIVRFFVIACIVSTVIAFAGPWHWYADLFSHFRVQYFVTLVIAVPFLWFLHMRILALIAGIACVANACVILPHFHRTELHSSPAPGTPTLRIISFNLLQRNTEEAKTNGPEVSAFIRNCGADVLVFQELTPALAGVLQQNADLYPVQSIRARKDSKGTALLSRLPARNVRFEELPGQTQIGAVAVEVETAAGAVTVFGIHSHKPTKAEGAESQRAYFAWLAKRAREVQTEGRPFVVTGDFNATPWSVPYRFFAKQCGLLDTSRGVVFGATWSYYLPYRLMIDHGFVSPEWRLLRREVGPSLGSDHRPLILDLALVR